MSHDRWVHGFDFLLIQWAPHRTYRDKATHDASHVHVDCPGRATQVPVGYIADVRMQMCLQAQINLQYYSSACTPLASSCHAVC